MGKKTCEKCSVDIGRSGKFLWHKNELVGPTMESSRMWCNFFFFFFLYFNLVFFRHYPLAVKEKKRKHYPLGTRELYGVQNFV